jgi:hypothetical protein
LRERLGGTSIPQVASLKELKSMIEQRIAPWPQLWEQKGFEEGLEKGRMEGLETGLETARAVLLQGLDKRFGPLPEGVRQKVEAIASIKDLTELSIRVGAAPSLAALKLS